MNSRGSRPSVSPSPSPYAERKVPPALSKESVLGRMDEPVLRDEKKRHQSASKRRSTTAAEMRNNYSQHFLNTGLRPQNYIRASTIDEGVVAIPRLARLLAAKEKLLRERTLPPFYLNVDLKSFDWSSLQSRFDVIMIDPPWEEYARRATAVEGAWQPCVWNFDEIARLNIASIADTFCVMFLWCGSGGRFNADRPSHLEEGYRLLQHWGFRRCEDICWLKTNKAMAGQHQQARSTNPAVDAILARTKEHCLVGMKGQIRRDRDGHLIHANVHTDIIVSEEPSDPSCTDKPTEVYRVIEEFCQGRRRIELFGGMHNIRDGWVTVGNDLGGVSNYTPRSYKAALEGEPGEDSSGRPCPSHLLGTSAEIENLRPKSPPPPSGSESNHHQRQGSSSSSYGGARTGRYRGGEGGGGRRGEQRGRRRDEEGRDRRGGGGGGRQEEDEDEKRHHHYHRSRAAGGRSHSTPPMLFSPRGDRERQEEQEEDRTRRGRDRSHTTRRWDEEDHDTSMYETPRGLFSSSPSTHWHHKRRRRSESPPPPRRRPSPSPPRRRPSPSPPRRRPSSPRRRPPSPPPRSPLPPPPPTTTTRRQRDPYSPQSPPEWSGWRQGRGRKEDSPRRQRKRHYSQVAAWSFSPD